MKKNNIIYIIFFVMILIDVYLLFERNEMVQYLASRNQDFFLDRYRSDVFNLESKYLSNTVSLQLLQKIPKNKQNKLLTLIFAFSDLDCSNCMRQEIPLLNELNQKNIKVLGFFYKKGSSSLARILSEYSINFQVINIDSLDTKLFSSQEKIKKTPLLLVINNKNGTITDVYQPIPNDLAKRDVFYKKLVTYIYYCSITKN